MAVEVELVAHGDGAFFERHMLRLHSPGRERPTVHFVDIAPDYDTLVFFPSFFPHEVLPLKCTYINIWIRRG
jgi:hypothetical protein